MSLTEQKVLAALRTVRYPGFNRDIVTLGVVDGLRVEAGSVEFEIVLGAGPPGVSGPIEQAARAAVQSLKGVGSVKIHVRDVSGHRSRSADPPSALRMAGRPRKGSRARRRTAEHSPSSPHTTLTHQCMP